MRTRKRVPVKPYPASWDVSTEAKVNGRLVGPGTEITFRDHNGRKRRTRFIHRVVTPADEWLTVAEIDRRTGRAFTTRSFSPDRAVTVHRIEKRRS